MISGNDIVENQETAELQQYDGMLDDSLNNAIIINVDGYNKEEK